MIPVILSGGSGTRLWPVSRQQMPKQFCDIFEKPLQTLTLERSQKLGTPWIVTSETLRILTESNLNQTKLSGVKVIYEPMSRNTAPAIAVLCHLLILAGHSDEVAAVFPSDHLVANESEFEKVVHFAGKVALGNRIVTLGIKPSYPETGYGYIQTETKSLQQDGSLQAFPVVKFHEKPELSKAESFLAQGGFSWNAGIFVFKISHMAKLFLQYQPEMWTQIQRIKPDLSNLSEVYPLLTSISVDYAIMEKLSGDELICIPADFGWSDVGSWDAVASLTSGHKVAQYKGQRNFVFGIKQKHYSTIGLDDVIAIDTVDALLLLKRGTSQDVKLVVEALAKSKSKLVKDHTFEYRPWGYFEVLKETPHFKSKIISVNPHSQTSYQSHEKREEHWTITHGFGEVVLNDEIIAVEPGNHVHIPLAAKHRIRNTGPDVLEFLEVQLGSYFGEDDIIRYQDDYQRV